MSRVFAENFSANFFCQIVHRFIVIMQKYFQQPLAFLVQRCYNCIEENFTKKFTAERNERFHE